jgi:hypothetical protein
MTRFVCNGANGNNGTNGTNGNNGLNSLIRTATEPAGSNCTYGGTKFEIGLDANDNNTLDNNEVIAAQTTYVCNATANVIYSDWVSDGNMAWGDSSVTFFGNITKAIIAAPSITNDIINKGTILAYWQPYGIVGGGTYSLPFTYKDGAVTRVIGYILNTGKIFYYWQDPINGVLPAKHIGGGPKYRYVVIPGAIAGGKISGYSIEELKSMPYEKVASLFNIPNQGTNTK